MSQSSARVWEEDVRFPTYSVGTPDRNPMFLDKRIYQGSSGAVYPLPVIDRVASEKHEQTYRAVFLENAYLKVMILPQIGGRVHMLLDKTNDYHAIYYQRVIKPALVGLCGPWCSGGIEFNWPQHHRPSTFSPIDYQIRANPDGSATCFLSEIDQMFGTKMLAGLTLHPDRAYLQIDVRLFNRTPLPQTFLWWANPACHVDEHHQSVFPPDVNAVMDHGKRDVSAFPIATGTYYKVDYSPGTDISRYKNIPVPTSYMAHKSDFDFVASYDHGRRAGLLHVANHHVAPGKKQWTWGCGDFGKAWDRQLTDEDGPYIELMCGVFTDNQPDFSWLHPYEEKSFTQYFMPYKQIARIKNATIDAAINLEVEAGRAYLGAYVTRPRKNLSIRLTDASDRLLYEKRSLDLAPDHAFEHTLALEGVADALGLQLTLLDEAGRVIVSYKPVQRTQELPSPAKPALPPERVESTEELFLIGQHLEQYRHATFDPEAYYREALRRDPGDARNNHALGLLLYRRGQFKQAEPYFRRAIERLTSRNPNPYDGEPFYSLGLCLRMQGRLEEAFAAFYKSTWSAAQRVGGFFQLAQIASIQGKDEEAIALADQSLTGNWHNHQARMLKVLILRKLGRSDEAESELQIIRQTDPIFGIVREDDTQGKIEAGIDRINAGLYDEAILELAPDKNGYPMLSYLAGWARDLASDESGASRWFDAARQSPPALCFPHRLEEMLALEFALRHDPDDGRAAYYLGNLCYARRNYDRAIEAWELAAKLCPDFPTVHRNLSLAYFNRRRDPQRALAAMERAFELDPTDARVLFELDQLRRKLKHKPSERLALMEKHEPLIQMRDDLYLERVHLLNLLGEAERAQALLAGRDFHPWEGGEGKVSAAYAASLLAMARRHLALREYALALTKITAARTYPHNLGEGKLPNAQENDLDYFAGLANRGLGRTDEAHACFARAARGSCEPVSAMFYNDQPPHLIFYQGLALRELGEPPEAERRFRRLLAYGQEHLNDHVKIDFFAVSLPELGVFDDDLDLRNQIHCRYMMGLGYLGLGEKERAHAELQTVLQLDPSHLGATLALG